MTFGLLIVVGSPVIGLLWAPAMAMLSDGAEGVGLEQGLAFGLMNLTWATGQSIGDIGGARLGDAAGDGVAYLVLVRDLRRLLPRAPHPLGPAATV